MNLKIFSLGQGGCHNVVLAGKMQMMATYLYQSCTSAYKSTELLDALGRERNKYSNIKETKAVSLLHRMKEKKCSMPC